MHSECALPSELPEHKSVCLLCKQNHHQPPVTHQHTVEAPAGHMDVVETPVQTDVLTREQTDTSEVSSGQRGQSKIDQVEKIANTQTPMELGKKSLMYLCN